jgi:hypothetical protein
MSSKLSLRVAGKANLLKSRLAWADARRPQHHRRMANRVTRPLLELLLNGGRVARHDLGL